MHLQADLAGQVGHRDRPGHGDRSPSASPDGAFIDEIFDSTADWIASPTAVQKMGEKAFAVNPVGAGPFEVVSDTLSSVLVLKKNPGYWQKGRPYLDTLTFKSVASDEAGYEALLAHEGQVYVDMSTPSLLQQAAKSSSLEVENQLSTSPYDLQLNTQTPPFNNPKARQAIYAATNFGPILQHVFDNMYPLRPGVHRTRRDLLRPDGARLPGLRPDPGQDAGPAERPRQRSRSTWARSRTWWRRRPPRRCRPSGPRSGSRPPSTPTPWPR